MKVCSVVVNIHWFVTHCAITLKRKVDYSMCLILDICIQMVCIIFGDRYCILYETKLKIYIVLKFKKQSAKCQKKQVSISVNKYIQ